MNQDPSQGHQVDLSRYNIRTDLARESHELATKRNRSGNGSIPGVRIEEKTEDGITTSWIWIENDRGAEEMGKVPGTYLTIEAPELRSRLTTTTVGHRSSRFQQDIPPMNNAIQRTTVQKTQYYVIIKVFGDFASADAYKQELRKEKFNANVFYYEKDRRYYVHVLNTEKSSDAYQEARNLKTYTKLKTARVLVIQPSK